MKINIPLIIAVTGHRDIIKDDEKKLRAKVREFFNELKQNNPHTPLILLSGLAEGADMLTAEEALKLGVELIAILPYEKKRYLQSFDDKNEIERFNKLLSQAKEVKVLEKTNEGAYVELAKYLAKHSNILLALWDGDRSNIKPGGTADVVQRKERGYEVENKLDINEEDKIVHIVTPRESNKYVKEPYTIKNIFIGRINQEDYNQILHHIDNLNKFLGKEDTQKILEERKVSQDASLLSKLRAIFSHRANRFQKEYYTYSVRMLLFAFFAVVTMEIVHNFGAKNSVVEFGFIMLYFILIIAIFGFYYLKLKDANLKNHFVHSRGLSEALRVQKFWFHLDKEPQRAGDYYLLGENNELVWLRAVLKNIYFLQTLRNLIPIDFDYVEKAWIDDQRSYFKKQIKNRKSRLEQLELAEKILYLMGAAFTLLLFVDYAMHLFEHLNHTILFAAGISFAAAAFIGEKYLPMTGLEEEIHNFKLMKYNFEVAKEKLSKLTNKSKKKEILYDLGEKALQENSRWLVYHSKYNIKPMVE